jgi:hypothetical protein
LLENVDGFLADVFLAYEHDSLLEVPLAAHMKAMHLLLAKCGGVFKDLKDTSDGHVLANLEYALRGNLRQVSPTAKLPEPVCPQVSELDVGGGRKGKPTASVKTLGPIALSALVHFERDGSIAQDAVFKLAQQGFVVGCRVKMQRGCLGLRSGSLGSMVGTEMGKVIVSWAAGSLQSGQNTGSTAENSSKSCH